MQRQSAERTKKLMITSFHLKLAGTVKLLPGFHSDGKAPLVLLKEQCGQRSSVGDGGGGVRAGPAPAEAV